MLEYPQVARDDPDFDDDPNIPDNETLWRGLLDLHLPGGLEGPISSSAFKTKQYGKIRRHISTYCKSCGKKEIVNIWKKLRKSVALCDIQAMEARKLNPSIVGICYVSEGLKSHTRIIRNRKIDDDTWQVVAVHLANKATVSLQRGDPPLLK